MHPNQPQREGTSEPNTVPPPTGIVNPSNCTPINAKQGQTQTRATQDESPQWIPFLTNGELVMSLLTAVYVVITWRGLRAIKKQADIAKKTADGFTVAERAWVLATLEFPGGYEQAIYPEGLYELTLVNHGRTPARIVEAKGELKELGYSETLAELPHTDILPGVKLLAPQETWCIRTFGLHADFARPSAAAFDKEELFFGHVAYKTIFDRESDPLHYTRFCYRLQVNRKWQVSGPPSYNEYT
jgi:hypothetical protein